MREIAANDLTRMWGECSEAIVRAISDVGGRGGYILGQEVEAFERQLALTWQQHGAIGCANGMDAIEMSLRALEISAGDKVLTTPLTAFASSLAIHRAGGTPVFVDVDDSGLLDLNLCETALRNDSSIKFMLPVHLYGHSLNLRRLAQLKSEFSLRVVEDGAQSVLARFEGIPVGSVGDMTATSFYPTKNLGALGDGGAILTNNRTLELKARCLRDYGQSAKNVHDLIGMNSRLDEIQASVLNKVFLPRLVGWTARRRAIADEYLNGIGNPLVAPLPPPVGSESVWHLFPVLVADGLRGDFIEYLKGEGIQGAIHYPHLVSEQRAFNCYQREEIELSALSKARFIAKNVASIPIYPYLNEDDVQYCIAKINKWRPG